MTELSVLEAPCKRRRYSPEFKSSSLGVLDGDEVIYIARSSAPHRLVAITLSTGTQLPAAYTSMGRILLAQLSDGELDDYLEGVKLTPYTDKTLNRRGDLKAAILTARQQGYAIVDQEFDSGLRSIAIPAFDTEGKLLGALNISTDAARVDMDTLLDSYLPLLKEKARQIQLSVSS
nr:IclR family transcriptional regulator C-terminal domain-containing protein [Halomonas azerica]